MISPLYREATIATPRRVPSAMQPMIQKLLDMKGLTDDEKNALLGLAATGPDFASLTSMA